ncbi:hypothetical protein [Pedobacter sp. FW305-3-2-15-E-R2A2]|uniref:hypothetical protein n=1 Tax=Pedobacter sp. FW305-3-2-15-E-R2A2 TaxID=3140251 RepID=UPI003140ABA0
MHYYRLVFYFLLIGLLLTSSMTSKNSFLLKTPHAKAGIYSLELTAQDALQDSILGDWKKSYFYQLEQSADQQIHEIRPTKINGLKVAYQQTLADFGFIFFYVGFLSLMFWRYLARNPMNPAAGKSRLWLYLTGMVLLAGLMDMIENFQLLRVIRPHLQEPYVANVSAHAWMVFVPAVIKFALLILAIWRFAWKADLYKMIMAWLKSGSAMLKFFIGLTWTYRIVLIVLFVLYALLRFSDQGQDLLVTINTSRQGTIIFYILISILAALNWYLPKIYHKSTPETSERLDAEAGDKVKLDYARLLGTITFLVPATGILYTMEAYHIPYLLQSIPVTVLFLAFILFYTNLLRFNGLDEVYMSGQTFLAKRYWISIILILFYIILLGFFVGNNQTPKYLAYLSIGFYLLSFGFLLTVTYRRKMNFLKEVKIGRIVIGVSLIVLVLFLAFNFQSVLFFFIRQDRFFSLPVVIAALITYVLIFSFLLIIGKKKGIQLITFLLLLGFVISFSWITDFHKIYTVSGKSNPDSLSTYVEKWIESRSGEITQFNQDFNQPYPVFFVNAHGGGIRATAWTTMVIGKLDQKLLGRKKNENSSFNDFQHYVFSYSGSSGGTVGLSLLCAARMDRTQPDLGKVFYPEQSSKIYEHDYLTGNIVGIFGRDAFMSAFGLHGIADRSRIQEIGWECFLKKRFGINYSRTLGEGWLDPAMNVPLLFSNTYDVNTGFKGIVSPLKLSAMDFPGALFIRDLIPEGQDLSLSTAALLSARFPYVSSTGKFDERHQFTDGGTIENSGGETSLQAIRVFNRVFKEMKAKSGEKYGHLEVKVNILSLPNGFESIDSCERIKNINQIFAPALGILNSINGNTIKSDSTNRYMAKTNNWGYYSIRPKLEKYLDVWPVLPLGWQISDYALKQMKTTLARQELMTDSILKDFPWYKRKLAKSGRN